MERNEVNVAFEMLLEEMEARANAVDEEGAKAFRAGNHERARQLLEDAAHLAAFREKVKALQAEWEDAFAQVKAPSRRGRRRNMGRLPRGLRTPAPKFRKPILESLVEFGGSAPGGVGAVTGGGGGKDCKGSFYAYVIQSQSGKGRGSCPTRNRDALSTCIVSATWSNGNSGASARTTASTPSRSSRNCGAWRSNGSRSSCRKPFLTGCARAV